MEEGVIYHDQDNQKFFIRINGNEGQLKYTKEGELLDFYYTYVPEEFRGKGVASKIVESALTFAWNSGFRVRPTCPFVSDYIKNHEQYLDLVE